MKTLTLPILALIFLPFLCAARSPKMGFVENVGQITNQQGQSRPDIDFKLNSPALSMFVGHGQIHYQWLRTYYAPAGQETTATNPIAKRQQKKIDSTIIYRMDVELLGANPHAQVTKEVSSSYEERYYLPATHFSGIKAHSWQKITYHNVYPNIDWVLYIKNNRVEYDFVVRPGGNVADIQLQYKGSSTLKLNEDWSLTATTPFGAVTENSPYAYQLVDKSAVPVAFQLRGNRVSFSAAPYSGTLIIDPTIIWGSYFGGTDLDQIIDVTTNKDGFVYATGGTGSSDNIATTGAYQTTFSGGSFAGALSDAFLAKFNADGNCIWSTYYGTTDEDCAKGISADTAGNIYIGGYTYSQTGFGTAGAFQDTSGGSYDAFLAKFDTSGTRLWGTYFGGNGDDGWYSFALQCDRFNNIYLTGATTTDTGLATPNAYQTALADPYSEDAYLAKFNDDGQLSWATYYGGTGGDDAFSVTTDTMGAVYIAGYTNSTTGIATAGAVQSTYGDNFDGFLVKFDSAGLPSWGTYYGGEDFDDITSIACDKQLNVFVVGLSASTTGIATANAFQITLGGGYQDGMIARYSSTGALAWSSYYGGSDIDQLDKVFAADNGGIYVSGLTGDDSSIITAGAPQTTFGGGYSDGIVARFDTAGLLEWGSYIGGVDGDEALAITGDSIGNLYVGGYTTSATGIATTGAWQTTFGGSDLDGFLVRIKDCVPPVMPDTIMGPRNICAGSVNIYSVLAANNTSYNWILPTGWQGNINTDSIVATSDTTSGLIEVVAYNSCDVSDTVGIAVTTNPVPDTPEIILQNSVLTTIGNYHSYQWYRNGQTINGATQPTYAPTQMGTYSVTVSNQAGCSATSVDFDYNLGIYGSFKNAGVKLYPNPANGKVYLELPFDAIVLITDLEGRILEKYSFQQGKRTINVGSLAAGMYIVVARSSDGHTSCMQKLVKTSTK